MESQAASSRPGWNGRVATGRALATTSGARGRGTRICTRSRSGTKPRLCAVVSSAAVACMTHRRTSLPLVSPPAACRSAVRNNSALNALGLTAVRRIDRHVQCRGAVESGGDEGAADQAGVVVGQHDLGAVSAQVRACRCGPLRFGQRGMVIGQFAARQERGQLAELYRVECAENQHIHAGTLTRYRGCMGRPRTPMGRARVAAERLGEEYPGTAAELCALQLRDPLPAPGGHHSFGADAPMCGSTW